MLYSVAIAFPTFRKARRRGATYFREVTRPCRRGAGSFREAMKVCCEGAGKVREFLQAAPTELGLFCLLFSITRSSLCDSHDSCSIKFINIINKSREIIPGICFLFLNGCYNLSFHFCDIIKNLLESWVIFFWINWVFNSCCSFYS